MERLFYWKRLSSFARIPQRFLLALTSVLLAFLFIGEPIAELQASEWRYNGSDAASTRYAPVSQIDSTNFSRLRMVWRWRAPDAQISATKRDQLKLRGNPNESVPLMIDGVLYVSTPFMFMAALDAATGRELWTFDPEAWKIESAWSVSRGVAFWSDGDQRRILMGTSSAYLYSLDADTGQPDPAFGDNGRIDLTQHLHRPVADRVRYGVSSPPIVCNGVVIVGSMSEEWRQDDLPEFMPLGDVRGFDVKTGELLWTFHTVPQEGELGNETWEDDSWKRFGGANVWAAMSADLDLGYVYLPISAPSHDHYGGERLGDNLFAETLACLDCVSGRRIWHYQIAHHGIWNYDLPNAPILMDITVDDKPVKAVVQLTKQAFAFAFDRVTGEPIWPIEERPVPPSKVPGERASPTQPFPTKPLAFDLQGLSEDDVIDFTPQLKQQALDILSNYDYGPLFTPSTERGTILVPGDRGGMDWVGGASDPRGWLYVPSKTSPKGFGLKKVTSPTSTTRYSPTSFTPQGPAGLPLVKPPYGRVTAIDMNTGEHRWMTPIGSGPVDHPLLRDMELPSLGWETRIFVLATPTLLMATTEPPNSIRQSGRTYYIDPEKYLSAYDLNDGHFIAQTPLPANARGNPMSYAVDGRQYVVVPAGGGRRAGATEFIALAIPREGEVLPPQGYERSDSAHPSFYEAVAAFDAGDESALQQLLDGSPDLALASGFLDSNYEHASFRGAGLIHLIAGHPQRTRLPDNALALADLLLEAGVDVNAVTVDSVSTLELLAEAEQPGWLAIEEQLFTRLIANGANASHKNGYLLWKILSGETPRPKLAKLLADNGARVDLRLAAGLNDVERMGQFFSGDGTLSADAGAAYRIPTRAPTAQAILDEALSFAAINEAFAAAEFLLDRGADINAMPPQFFRSSRDRGVTALHKAVEFCRPQMARFLLEREADPMLGEPRRGESALDWARDEGCSEVREIFQQYSNSE
ncbi:MAG: PQQ-binding-like beta-propeller repeat protein [Candidatus Latescibacteria bacterium]|nr:PQQ-binding-like beta-propeller repeat protein [Candidatus Latescibacterota bacterium]